MSKLTYSCAVAPLLTAVLLVALSSCASTGSGGRAADVSPRSSSSAAGDAATTTWPCARGAEETTATVGAARLPIARLGGGSRAVVLSNESDEDACAWLPLARRLSSEGYQVVLYDYVGDPVEDLSAVVGFLRSHGVAEVALVGASEGAKASILVASDSRPTVNAVVSLSAEAALAGTPIAPAAARMTCPTLFVTGSDDAYGATAATRGYAASEPATVKQLVVVPGSAHGTALLSDASVRSAVIRFLADHDR